MTIIPAVKITDPKKKNEMILYARSLGCKAVHSEIYQGMCIESNDRKATKKIKELLE